MKARVVTAVLVLASQAACATGEKAQRQPSASPNAPFAKVVVQELTGSKFERSEKWVDKENQTVCYAIGRGSTDVGSGVAISCVRVENPQ